MEILGAALLLLLGVGIGGALAGSYFYDRGRDAGRREVLLDWFDARTNEAARRAGVGLPWWPGDAPRADGG